MSDSTFRLTQVGNHVVSSAANLALRLEQVMDKAFRDFADNSSLLFLVKEGEKVLFTGKYADAEYGVEVCKKGSMYMASLLLYKEPSADGVFGYASSISCGLATKVYFEENLAAPAPYQPNFVSTTWYIHVDAYSINSNHGRPKQHFSVTESDFKKVLSAAGEAPKEYEITNLGYDDISIRCPGWSKEEVKSFMDKLNAVLPPATDFYKNAYAVDGGFHNASAMMYNEEQLESYLIPSDPASDTMI